MTVAKETGAEETGLPGSGPFAAFGSMPWGNTQDCMLCPFGLTFFALRNTKPEVMEHLMKAGMELALAFKAVVEAAAERMGSQEPGNDGLKRITID